MTHLTTAPCPEAGRRQGGPHRRDTPRTASAIMNDLRVAIRAEGITPPYVLVGWSMGGLIMRLLAFYPRGAPDGLDQHPAGRRLRIWQALRGRPKSGACRGGPSGRTPGARAPIEATSMLNSSSQLRRHLVKWRQPALLPGTQVSGLCHDPRGGSRARARPHDHVTSDRLSSRFDGSMHSAIPSRSAICACQCGSSGRSVSGCMISPAR